MADTHDDCIRQFEGYAEEITRLKRMNQALWHACAKAAELIQHDEDGTGKWMAVDVLEKAVDDCIEHETAVDTLASDVSMFDLMEDEPTKEVTTRALDALVHVRVMGNAPVDPNGYSWQDGYTWSETYYSTDIAAAWAVVSKLYEQKYTAKIYRGATCVIASFAHFDMLGNHEQATEADTAPLAICIAALRAVGVAQTDIDAAMKRGTT